MHIFLDKAIGARNKKRIDGVISKVVVDEIEMLNEETAPPIPTFTSMLNVDEKLDATIAKSAMLGNTIPDDSSSFGSIDSSQVGGAKSKASGTDVSALMATFSRKQRIQTQRKIEAALVDFKKSASLYDEIDSPVKSGVIPPNELEDIFWSMDSIVSSLL